MYVFFFLKSNLNSAHKGPTTAPLVEVQLHPPHLLSGLTPRHAQCLLRPGLNSSWVPPTTPPCQSSLPVFSQGHPRASRPVCLRSQEWLPRERSLSWNASVSGCWPTGEQPILPRDNITISMGPARKRMGRTAGLPLKTTQSRSVRPRVFRFHLCVNGSHVSDSSPDFPPERQTPTPISTCMSQAFSR